MKGLAVLGSTGSIGRQTLEVVRRFPDRLKVVGLAGGKNTALLAEQLAEFKPPLVSFHPETSLELPPASRPLPLEELAAHPEVEVVVVATSGKAGLAPTLAALEAGKAVALANKEVLVMAGEMVTATARRHRASILPIDSEHSAIWQCLQGEDRGQVARFILTASGGPFLAYSSERLARVTPEEALRHPVWKMGPKVTIDSATLMNKGMEVIEAHWLFHMPYSRIEVVLHPQSIVHSLVEFVDGSTKAQLGLPDMRLPIQYALFHPERCQNPELPRLDFDQINSLTFEPLLPERFPCLQLAREAGENGGTYPAALSAADEVAVELFLAGKIPFPDIPRLVGETLERHNPTARPSLDDILAADDWARRTATSLARPC